MRVARRCRARPFRRLVYRGAMMTARSCAAVLLGTLCACTAPGPEPASPPAADYLYLWTASADAAQPDFLAVLDVSDRGERYGRLVTTLPVPGRANRPHHTEHEMPADGQLFANGFATGQSFVFDLVNPRQPRIVKQFGDVEGYGHPHSFLRLPNGNVLATFQMRHEAGKMTPGGLVELTPAAAPVRSSSADAPGIDQRLRVYSGGIVPAFDRIVTTTTDMNGDSAASRNLQVWRLSDLRLLHTVPLPDGPAGNEGLLTAEPRLMADGTTMLVSTFNCGLYLVEGLPGDTPSPDQRRVVVTGYKGMQHRAVIARFEPATGQLAWDTRFRENGATEPGFRMDDKTWPHGGSAKGIPHGAVFSRPATRQP